MSRRFVLSCTPAHSCHSGAMQSIEPGISRFRVWSFGPSRNDDIEFLQQGITPMASIHKDILIDANPNDVWDALRDFGALHTRLVPGFVTDTKLDGDARIVTFANGTVAREIL